MKRSRGAGRRFPWRLVAPLFASILGLCTLKLLSPELVSRTQLLHWLRPLGAFTPWAYVALLTVRPLTLLPGQLLTAIGGLLFGGWKGTLLALGGSALASSITFALGRRWGRHFMRRLAGPRAEALVEAARANDFLFALVFTLNPLVPTDPIIALAASAGARYGRTLAGTLLGILPGTLATAYFGSALAAGHPWVIGVSIAGWAVSVVGGIWVAVRVFSRTARAPAGAQTLEQGRPRTAGRAPPIRSPS